MAFPKNKIKKKSIAEESFKTKKAREKLRKKMDLLDVKMTREVLQQKIMEIQKWISKHANQRVTLRDKSISLFDENQNVASCSLRISKIAEKLKKGEVISD